MNCRTQRQWQPWHSQKLTERKRANCNLMELIYTCTWILFITMQNILSSLWMHIWLSIRTKRAKLGNDDMCHIIISVIDEQKEQKSFVAANKKKQNRIVDCIHHEVHLNILIMSCFQFSPQSAILMDFNDEVSLKWFSFETRFIGFINLCFQTQTPSPYQNEGIANKQYFLESHCFVQVMHAHESGA